MENNPPSSGSQWPHPSSGYMAPQNFAHPYPMQLQQFHPSAQSPHGQQFIHPQDTQQFHPPGQSQNFVMHHGQSLPPQFSQPMQQFMPRPTQIGHAGPPSHPQSSMPMTSGVPQTHDPAGPSPGVSFSSSYTFSPSSFGLPQSGSGMSSQFQPSPQPWLHSSQSTPVAPLQQALNTSSTVPAVGSSTALPASDWQEFEAADGRRYYYNKTTKQTSWEKPADLMTSLERADASTVWKEFTTPEGRKYYYNKETKQSKWTIPDELKLARELPEKSVAGGGHSVMNPTVPITPTGNSVKQPPPVTMNMASSTTPVLSGVASSPASVTPVGFYARAPTIVTFESPAPSALHVATAGTLGVSSLGEAVVSPSSIVLGISGAPVKSLSDNSMPMSSMENPSPHVGGSPLGGTSFQDTEDENKGIEVSGKLNGTPVEEKAMDGEPLVYATKQEAKSAFKALLESANVECDWNWDQAMRVIINDKRYGALRTLGERKQAFNEYLMQRKKVEAEERRSRQRKAKEEFMKMLEEAKELTSSTRWSKAVTMFEDDKRFKAVERETAREDLFRNFLVDLHKKEKAKAQEEYQRNRLEFRQFLESCAYIKVDSQWRKVQDLLEDDERCTRLDKVVRLDIFQDYIHDLEKEEDELKKRQKEQLRRVERKNRDAFRTLLEENIADGTLTAKTHWRDYCQNVKDSEAYKTAASNISGFTPKDLFDDATEELENKYDEDKSHIKDALKQEKITIASTCTFEEFKSSIEESIGSLSVSDINLQLVYVDLIDRAKEKEEKEAKKRKRLAKDFTDKLRSLKEINGLSTWEECKQLVVDSSEYRSLGEESLCQEIFDEYATHLQEKVEKERRREEEKDKKEKDREEKEKRKDKDRREKDKENEGDKDLDRKRDKEKGKDGSRRDGDTENMDVESYGHNDEKKRGKDKDRKHRRRRHSSPDDVSSDREETKRIRRHDSVRKMPRKHAHSPESESESKHKRHRRGDHSRRSGGGEELEDGELGEDGDISNSYYGASNLSLQQ